VRATIKDIAAYCNVSEGTVDRALNNRYGIGERTKRRVLDAAEKLNYKPNHAGRSLATGLTMTIGIVCFDLDNNFFPELIDTIESEAKQRGYFIHLILKHMDRQKERQGLEYLSARRVDGIILFPIGIGDEYVAYLKGLDIPVVTVYNWLSPDFSHVGVDNLRAMRDAVDWLAARKYERVAFMTPSIDAQEVRQNNVHILKQRLAGYLEGIHAHGMEPLYFQGMDRSLEMSREYAAQRERRTAILCSCDSYALKILAGLNECGANVPGDVGLMGFDNVDVLRYVTPRLTTVKYSVQKMGEVLFQSLYERIMDRDKAPCEILLPYEIVEGATV